MALAGVTCVGEFHYVHHERGGTRYADPNLMGKALIEAACQAGIRVTLLDACYLAGGLTADGRRQPLEGAQLRFGDGDGAAWAARVSELWSGTGDHGQHARPGAAIHSVRAVPPDQMPAVAAWSRQHGAPLHAHLSEQVAENRACLAAYQATPAEILGGAGVLGPRATALLEEARRVELGERLASGERGHFTAPELAMAATAAGHASLGWPDAGDIAPGGLADLVTVALDSPRTAGAFRATALESVIFGATAADVRSVVVSGRDVVADGRHLLVPDVPAELAAAIAAVLP
jgi:cytosine/adenosine deaminase-related metal-dependent hydrolase